MKKTLLLLYCLAWLCWAAPVLSLRAEPIAIIVNKANDTHSLKSNDLARIYKGQLQRWSDGQRIAVINRPVGSQIRLQFYHRVLGSNPTKKFFRAGSPIPFKTLRSKSALTTRKLIARVPNAVGYIYLSQVDDTIKVIKIDRALP